MARAFGCIGLFRCASAVAVLSGLLLAGGEAEAALMAASTESVKAADCGRQTYFGLESGATADRCERLFFIPTSAGFKCNLYKEAGYPSSLMKKACLLFDSGYIQSFTQGAENLED